MFCDLLCCVDSKNLSTTEMYSSCCYLNGTFDISEKDVKAILSYVEKDSPLESVKHQTPYSKRNFSRPVRQSYLQQQRLTTRAAGTGKFTLNENWMTWFEFTLSSFCWMK